MKYFMVESEFRTHGFNQKDLSKREWEIVTDEYMKLRNKFCELVNGPEGYKQLNKDFDAFYPDIENVGEENVDGYVYGSFLAWRLNDMLRAKMKKDNNFMKSDLLEPYIFMDGNVPDMGARLKNHDNWTIDLLLRTIGS